MLRGLDASSVQGAIPFDKLGPEYEFVILKAQQGNDGFDPWFAKNMAAAKARGLVVFAYCFAYPLPHLSPEDQAKRFVDALKARGYTGRIFLDFEWPEVVPLKPAPGKKGWREWGCYPAQLADWMGRNARATRDLSGLSPAIYIYDWWWAAVRDGAPAYGFPTAGDVSWASDYDLWMAWYRNGWPSAGDNPKVPRPFKSWAFWQFDGNGGLRLPNGVDSDFCVFNGTRAELEAWAAGEDVIGRRLSKMSPVVDVSTVRGLQTRLVALGFNPGPIDGIRGVKTDAAVREFQRARGLVVDGIVGPKTVAALLQ
jgi:GH25 family lysozyme M1 (1,4-beta-N-acetylmuramidase)